MKTVEEILGEAAQLPLYDAAYYLWRRQWEVDWMQKAASPPPSDASLQKLTFQEKHANFKKLVRESITRLAHEMTGAPDTRIFRLLKRAHPEMRDQDLQGAIRATTKFESDCIASLRRQPPPRVGFDRYRQAVIEAKELNPGFRDETYEQAIRNLVRDDM